ncbi:MAG TPA: hypothetical protein VG184_00165 [Acidimicrobiales bacterium]|jgi:hypothetical protein|nr:hypothetical protein [Acidimicrobiales bacterium]
MATLPPRAQPLAAKASAGAASANASSGVEALAATVSAVVRSAVKALAATLSTATMSAAIPSGVTTSVDAASYQVSAQEDLTGSVLATRAYKVSAADTTQVTQPPSLLSSLLGTVTGTLSNTAAAVGHLLAPPTSTTTTAPTVVPVPANASVPVRAAPPTTLQARSQAHPVTRTTVPSPAVRSTVAPPRVAPSSPAKATSPPAVAKPSGQGQTTKPAAVDPAKRVALTGNGYLASDPWPGASLRAATHLTVPILFGAVVLLFIIAQALVDRRDPKLARAPTRGDDESVGFK